MQKLININFDGEKPTVSGRELHAGLGVKTQYNDWFARMCEYGFADNKDFYSILSKSTGGRPSIDHALTVDMAKELCMLQRNEKGKMFRQYFISVEETWNNPDRVIERAVTILQQRVADADKKIAELTVDVAQLETAYSEIKPKADYCDEVLKCENTFPITLIANQLGTTAVKLNRLLKDRDVQYKVGGCWVLKAAFANIQPPIARIETTKIGERIVKQLKWTEAGAAFIHNIVKCRQLTLDLGKGN